MFRSLIFRTTLLAISLAAASCVAPLSVRHIRPAIPPAVATNASTLRIVRLPNENDPLSKVGKTLDALRDVSDRLTTGDLSVIPEYNYLVARVIDQLIAAKVRPWHHEVKISSARTHYIVRGNQPVDLLDSDPNQLRQLIPTDRLEFRGEYSRNEAIKAGIGAPLIAFLPLTDDQQQLFGGSIRFRNVTALVRFSGDQASVSLEDPYHTENVRFGNQELPLAACFGANFSYALSTERIDKLGLSRLLKPGNYLDTTWIGNLQPYDPDRIPVLFVHGLQDTPASWLPMYLDLMADPEIRKRYQFWAFSYPSGYPYPISASHLRLELARFRRSYPSHKDIVVIGHSMGGLITRTLVTDVGEKIWTHYFGSPPAQTAISGESRKIFEDAMVFNSHQDISRAIFIATPHRGSVLANMWIGRLVNRLVKLPANLVDGLDAFDKATKPDGVGVIFERAPSSIDSLSPDSRFIVAINKFPVTRRVPFHSIMGDRGLGDTSDSSDGVVAYWSSHLDGARSEKIVPSGHSVHQDPEGIEEVRRILYLHTGVPYTPHSPPSDRVGPTRPRSSFKKAAHR